MTTDDSSLKFFFYQDELNQLLRYPTAQWKKAQWKNAALILSAVPPPWFLHRSMFFTRKKDLIRHIRTNGEPARNKAGRTRTISLELAESQLQHVENIKIQLVSANKTARCTDRMAAKDLADYMIKADPSIISSTYSKEHFWKDVQGRIKYYRKVVKLGN